MRSDLNCFNLLCIDKKMLENFHMWVCKINEKKSKIYCGFQNGRNVRVNLQMQEIVSQITSDSKYSTFRI